MLRGSTVYSNKTIWIVWSTRKFNILQDRKWSDCCLENKWIWFFTRIEVAHFVLGLVILKQGSSHLERYKIVSSSTFDISKFLIHKKFHKYWMTVVSFTLWSLLRSSAMASVSLNCFTRSPCSWAAASRGPSTVLLNKEKQGANADKKIYHL